MKKKKAKYWRVKRGEVLRSNLKQRIRGLYRPDTPLDLGIVPYLIVVFCGCVDGVLFRELMFYFSYDDPQLLWLQVAVIFFGFDIVPLYLGIQYKRYREGMTKEKVILVLAFSVFCICLALNSALRWMTIGIMQESATQNDIQITLAQTPATQAVQQIDTKQLAQTVYGIVAPVITSIGSFFISYTLYKPLQIKKRRLEEEMAKKKEEIRLLEAVLNDYDNETNYGEALYEEDEGKFQAMWQMQRAMALGYCDYVRQWMKEAIGSPSASNALSRENSEQILSKLDRELALIRRDYFEREAEPEDDESVLQFAQKARKVKENHYE